MTSDSSWNAHLWVNDRTLSIRGFYSEGSREYLQVWEEGKQEVTYVTERSLWLLGGKQTGAREEAGRPMSTCSNPMWNIRARTKRLEGEVERSGLSWMYFENRGSRMSWYIVCGGWEKWRNLFFDWASGKIDLLSNERGQPTCLGARQARDVRSAVVF